MAASPLAGLPASRRGAGAKPGNGRCEAMYLYPGRLFVSREPCAVTTILGSCVAVCLWDPVLRAGGVNHFVLPYRAGPRQSSTRLGNVAMEKLIAEMLALGSRRRDLQAKMFGGARILDLPDRGGKHLGERNVDLARELLEREGIPVVAQDVGGEGGRKLIFHTGDGRVWVENF